VLKRVDFSRSGIQWETKAEGSLGTFQLESVLTFQQDVLTVPEVFGLSVPVLAGHMFVSQGLLKNPPYLFQIVAGKCEHTIFRTYLPIENGDDDVGSQIPSGKRLTDTVGVNSEIFRRLDVNLDVESAKVVGDFEEIAFYFDRRSRFSGKISHNLSSGGTVELEFPIKHINLLPGQRLWQVETGPVLFFDCCWELIGEHGLMSNVLPCFIHFNRLDRIELTPDFPLGKRICSGQKWSPSRVVNCSVQLLVGDKYAT
jgi:hypothetical protein